MGHVRCGEALSERGTPKLTDGSRVGQDIDPALDGDFDAVVVGNMSEDRLASAVGLGHDRLGQIQRHRQDAVCLDGICKDLDAVCAVTDLLAHPPCRLRG